MYATKGTPSRLACFRNGIVFVLLFRVILEYDYTNTFYKINGFCFKVLPPCFLLLQKTCLDKNVLIVYIPLTKRNKTCERFEKHI